MVVVYYKGDDGLDGHLAHGFELALVINRTGTANPEIICHRCKGIGHPVRKCSSLDIPRSFDYVISLLQAAQEKHKGKPAGHPAPHGERGLSRARPRDQRRARDNGHSSAPPARRQLTTFGAVASASADDYDYVVRGDEDDVDEDLHGHAAHHARTVPAHAQPLTYKEEESDVFGEPFKHAIGAHVGDHSLSAAVTLPDPPAQATASRARALICDSGATSHIIDLKLSKLLARDQSVLNAADKLLELQARCIAVPDLLLDDRDGDRDYFS